MANLINQEKYETDPDYARIVDMSNAQVGRINDLEILTRRQQSVIDAKDARVQLLASDLRQANETNRGQAKRIGELAASNFAIRLQRNLARKQLKKLLKLDRKARKAGIGHS